MNLMKGFRITCNVIYCPLNDLIMMSTNIMSCHDDSGVDLSTLLYPVSL